MSKDSSSTKKVSKTPNVLMSAILSLGTIFLYLLGNFLGIFIFVMLLYAFGLDQTEIESLSDKNPIFTQFVAILFIETITIGALYLVHRYFKKDFLKSVWLNMSPKLHHLGNAVIGYGLYFLAFIAVVFTASVLIPALNVDQAQDIGFDSPVGSQYLAAFVALVVLPAIAEEIVFRGFLFNRLKNQIGIIYGALITSAIFGLAHLEFLSDNPLNWIAAIDTFVLSLFLIWVMLKTKSLWSSIILHSIKNSIAFVVLFII